MGRDVCNVYQLSAFAGLAGTCLLCERSRQCSFSWWVGKRLTRTGLHAQSGSDAHIDSGMQVLKFLPMEKAKDARNFVQALQYWLGGNRENLENLLLSTAQVDACSLSSFTPHFRCRGPGAGAYADHPGHLVVLHDTSRKAGMMQCSRLYGVLPHYLCGESDTCQYYG